MSVVVVSGIIGAVVLVVLTVVLVVVLEIGVGSCGDSSSCGRTNSISSGNSTR